MYHPTIFFDPQFTIGVMAGWLLQAAGVGALLLAGLWFSIAGEWRRGTPAPTAFRALTGLGLVEGLTKVFYPEASNTVIFVIMALVLLVKPAGLFGRAQ
jgi:branched-subunit amino acid ABC-type transport system permease component